ncbi:MAG: VTT domain-containing protein [Lachnospiraceae bacterium]|jgi:uncharacterized membrane protein YdjX (TVP38/TMEM64 family)|nr:VTT domain-containing protein [Lachnospiraceae bacterium]
MRIWQNSFWYKFLKAIGGIAVVAAVVYLVWQAFGQMLPDLIPLLKEGNSEKIAAYLEEEGAWTGMLCVFVLAFLQVVSIIMPGMPIQVAAGAIYGWWKGFIICFLGYWMANLAVFMFARKVNNRMLEKVSSGKKTAWLMEKLNSTQPGFVIGIACLLPGIPNGIVPYIAARSRIRFWEFAEAVAVGCWIPIFCFCLTGRFLLQGKYVYGVVVIIIQIVIIVVVILKRDWFLSRIEASEKRKKKEYKEL